MSFLFKPWHLLVLIAACAAHGDHQRAIEYLMAENRVLKRELDDHHPLCWKDKPSFAAFHPTQR
jgi:hypothetical protein